MVAKEPSANQTPAPRADAVPKDAAAVVLVRGEGDGAQVFWARRGKRMAFLGGFYAFPGGQRDADDAETPVDGCDDAELAAMISCAARELFEETGVLAARGADSLTKGQLASVLDDFTSGRMTFAALLAHYGLRLDARDFQFVGRWVTPPFSPRRFDTWFFLVACPRKQEPRLLTAEFDAGGWTTARAAFDSWLRSEIVAAPPVMHAVRTLAAGLTDVLSEGRRLREIVLTHHHPDHVAGVETLRAHAGGDVRVAEHRLTAE